MMPMTASCYVLCATQTIGMPVPLPGGALQPLPQPLLGWKLLGTSVRSLGSTRLCTVRLAVVRPRHAVPAS